MPNTGHRCRESFTPFPHPDEGALIALVVLRTLIEWGGSSRGTTAVLLICLAETIKNNDVSEKWPAPPTAGTVYPRVSCRTSVAANKAYAREMGTIAENRYNL